MVASGVRLGPDGELVVLRSSPPEDRARLVHAVEVLRSVPGVGVDVVSVDDVDGRLEVRLAYAGRSPELPLPGDVAAPLGARVAAALADLHAGGVAHRRLTVDHVLVASDGTVRLCGFGDAGPGAPADDVAALGRLLDQLVAPGDRSPGAGAVRAAAQRARAEDAAARPTAAAIAASLASVLDPPAVAASKPPRHAPRRPLGSMTAAIGAAAVLLVVMVVLAAPSGGGESTRPVASTSTTAESTTTTTRPLRIWPASTPVLEGDGARWTFGAPGDMAVTGDWDCDGVPTPAVVRPDGTVWVVRAWPSSGEAAGELVGSVGEPTDVDVVVDGDCDVLVVRTAAGEVRPLRHAS